MRKKKKEDMHMILHFLVIVGLLKLSAQFDAKQKGVARSFFLREEV